MFIRCAPHHLIFPVRTTPQAKAQLIQARFEHLEARTLAQADLHEGSVDKLQETNRQVGENTNTCISVPEATKQKTQTLK